MKKTLFTLLTLLALVITGCNHRNCCVLPDPPNSISAQKNGANWNAPSQITYYKKTTANDTLNLIGHIGEENINFLLKKTSENSYTLVDATYFTTVGQDAIVTSYSLDKSQNNRFTVTVSTDGKIFKGIFSVYLKQTYGNPPSSAPGTLSFQNGFYKATWQ